MTVITTARIVCDRCGNESPIELPTAGAKPRELPVGWRTGTQQGKHLCPACGAERDELLRHFNERRP